MNIQTDSAVIAPEVVIPTRPMYWSIRRELWENRSIYLAPLFVACVLLFGFLISIIGLPHRRRAVSLLSPAQQQVAIEKPYDIVAGLLFVTAFVVGFFYCLDALHGERRDRSILFWKSLPVSDRATVLSKASIPLVILPLITLAIVLITQFIFIAMSTAVLLMSRLDPAMLWSQMKYVPSPLIYFYVAPVIVLWHAPIYAWLLLVSGWARRATFLWAVLPFFAVSIFEKMAFGTTYFGYMLRYRLAGWMTEGFVTKAHGKVVVDPLTQLTPGNFLMTPGLWVGLAFAAVCLAAAVRLRRYREPI